MCNEDSNIGILQRVQDMAYVVFFLLLLSLLSFANLRFASFGQLVLRVPSSFLSSVGQSSSSNSTLHALHFEEVEEQGDILFQPLVRVSHIRASN